MVGSKPSEISEWIVKEIDQHSKCRLRQELSAEYIKEIKRVEQKLLDNQKKFPAVD